MLFVLRLSASHPLQRRRTPGRASIAGNGLWFVFEIPRDDRLEAGVCAWITRVDRIDAEGTKPLDVECELDRAKGGYRSRHRTSGVREIDDSRISAPQGLDSAGSQPD